MKSELAYRISAAIVMSGFMSTALSGVFTWLEFGLSLKWLVNWSYAITIAWPVAAGLDLVFGAGLRRLSSGLAAAMAPGQAS